MRSRFEEITGPAIEFGNENNARTEINLEDIASRHVKVFARMRDSGLTTAGPGESYVVQRFSHGLMLKNTADWGSIQTKFDAQALAELPAPEKDAIAALPPPTTWVNIRLADGRCAFLGWTWNEWGRRDPDESL